MVRGTVRGSDSGVAAHGVCGGSGSGSAYRLLNTVSRLNGVSPLCWKAETIVVCLNVWFRIGDS